MTVPAVADVLPITRRTELVDQVTLLMVTVSATAVALAVAAAESGPNVPAAFFAATVKEVKE